MTVSPVTLVLIDAFGRKRDLSSSNGIFVLPLSGHSGSARVLPGSRDGSALAKLLKRQILFPSAVLDAQGSEGQTEKVQISLQALQVIATALAGRPGRKDVIWIGPGWPHLSSTGNQTKMRNYLAGIVDSLRDGRVTLSEVDPGSVTSAFLSSQKAPGYSSEVSTEGLAARSTGGLSAAAAPSSPNPQQAFGADFATLQSLALFSGGMVLGKERSVEQQLQQAMVGAEGFYVLSYRTPVATRMQEFHAQAVTVRKSGATVFAPAGYFANPAGTQQNGVLLP